MRALSRSLAVAPTSLASALAASAAALPQRPFTSTSSIAKVHESGLGGVKIPSWATSITDFLLGDVTSKYNDVATIEHESKELLSYAKLKERVDWMAIQFYIRGWEQGEMVAVFMPNKPLFTVTCLGAAKVGIPFTVVDPASSPFELQHQLKDSRAIYIVTTSKLLPVVRQVTAAMRGLKEILILDREEEEKKELRFTIEMRYNLLFGKPPGWGALPDWTVKPEDTAAIHYGPAIRGAKPKGLVVTHRNFIANVLQAEKAVGITKDDVLLSAVPYFRLDTYTLINNLALHKGAKSITLEDATSANVASVIQEQKVTVARLSVSLLSELAKANADLSSLKRVIVDPSEADVATAEAAFKKAYPNVSVGMSYAAPLLTNLNPNSNGSGAGRLLAGTSAIIADASGASASGDKEGSLLVKGDQVPTSFLNSDEANKVNFRDGFLVTGDRAKVDKDGNFHIAARPPRQDD